MNLFFRFSIALIFILFSFLQLNDSHDSYIWAFVYALTAVSVFFKKPILKFEGFFLLSLCSFLFIKNVDILLTSIRVENEIFYELGGILLILIVSYFKFSKENSN